MTRTPKRREKLDTGEIASAIVVLNVALATLQQAKHEIENDGYLAVEYKPSLTRSLKSLETFSNSLRMAIEYHRAGTPATVDEFEEVKKVLESTAKEGVSRKRKSTRKRGG